LTGGQAAHIIIEKELIYFIDMYGSDDPGVDTQIMYGNEIY